MQYVKLSFVITSEFLSKVDQCFQMENIIKVLTENQLRIEHLRFLLLLLVRKFNTQDRDKATQDLS